MDKVIKVRQSNIAGDKNVGIEIKGIPLQGVQLPTIDLLQDHIISNENAGISFDFSSNSGPVQLGHIRVEGDEGKVIINPDAGSVTINPSAGSVHFLYRK